MKINGIEIKAAIFDLDGTLIDSNNLWKDVDKSFFMKRDMDVPEDYAKKIAHIGLKDAAIVTKREYLIKESIEEIMQEWEDMAIDFYTNKVKLKPYARKLLEKLKHEGIIITLATANKDTLYMPCLKRLGIDKYFDFMVSVDDVGEGKNSVKLYKYISTKINVKENETIVLEDIVTGLKTAYLNNYIPIAVYDKYSNQNEKDLVNNSYMYIHSFKELLDK